MTTTLFIISLFGLFILFLFKAIEIKFGKVSFLQKVYNKSDDLIYSFLESVNFKYNRYKKITKIFIFEFIPFYIYELLVKAKDAVARKYYSVGDEFRGRRVLRNKGSVSFFLERLSEEKQTRTE